MKYKIMIAISIFLIVISFFIVLEKSVIPTMLNEKYLATLKVEQQNIITNLDNASASSNGGNKFERPVPKTDDDRVKVYIGEYIGLINQGKYEEAYTMLYPNFKNVYFPSIDKYTEYCKNTYSTYRTVNIVKYKKEDKIFIAEVKLDKLVKNGQNDSIIQYFTFIETASGKYQISFSR